MPENLRSASMDAQKAIRVHACAARCAQVFMILTACSAGRTPQPPRRRWRGVRRSASTPL